MGSLKAGPEFENGSTSMLNPLDPEEFRKQGHMIVDFLADYYQNVEKYPVRSQVEPGYLPKCLPESAPYEPEPIETILQDVQMHIMPGITHWQSPNYFAYFPSSGSTAGFLGEMLSAGFNVVGFNWMSSPAATELESIVMDWLGKMLQLPMSFLFCGNGGGVLQGTTCEAILCTLIAARDQILNKIGRDSIGKLVVYGSDQTHFALQKATKIAGINPECYRQDWLTHTSNRPWRLGASKDETGGLFLFGAKRGLNHPLCMSPCQIRDLIWRLEGEQIENSGKGLIFCYFGMLPAVMHDSALRDITGKANFRAISTTKSTAFGLSADSLEPAILLDVESGLIPLFLCASVGTTSTTAIDPLGLLCDVAKRYDMWVHVDAAYTGSACICPEFRHYIDGVEGANSFSLNAHKWFFTNLDCCCLWVKDPNALIKALSTNPEYLRNKATESKQVVDYKDWQIALSRRFRAMKLWLVLRSYGVANLRNLIRGHINMAKHFEGLVAMDSRFEVVAPRNFGLVCFRISPLALTLSDHNHNNKASESGSDENHANEINSKLLESINASGRMYMSHGVIGGVYAIRFAVGATLSNYQHVDLAWQVIQDHAHAILAASLNSPPSFFP
ncbi:hypothetical protein HYC85_018109 [Camellia sinensis]|uniref:Rhodanese domain-containing protein n=1 Tax=Camellia sinensis TaxID=4442 RepID=A0A7J7GTD4_CAMSI|nr:hypothetical protein HYC85_018109 [Camellia sinensis]